MNEDSDHVDFDFEVDFSTDRALAATVNGWTPSDGTGESRDMHEITDVDFQEFDLP